MIYFDCDYNEGCHDRILKKLTDTNFEQTIGYGEDAHCANAADLIKKECGRTDVDVHFLTGGTQANLTVICAALRPHQGALCAESGHINVHESGAVEGCGHKVLPLPSKDGKITPEQVRSVYRSHQKDSAREHTVQPKLVYISNATEMGTVYTKTELEQLYAACRECGYYLYLDGARLGYAIAAGGASIAETARNCDVFYIGGTKVGALFGEAVVIVNRALKADFRYIIKQKGGLLAKGRLLGVQFETLFEDGLYYQISGHAVSCAEKILQTLRELRIPLYADSPTNMVFPLIPNTVLEELQKYYVVSHWAYPSESHTVIRICTSWATREDAVLSLCNDLKRLFL